MKKRILSILLICCMVFSLFPVSALAANSDMPFTDVKTTDWFYDEVCYAYEHGLMQGTSATTFDPDGTTSRGMIVTILYRLEGEPSFMNANIFTDVVPDSWYEKAVVWANGKSIVEGYGNEKFGPDDPITREQLATIMYRYANYKGYDTAAKADLSDFVDSGKISGYALDAMKWANAAGLINGIGASKLDPQGDAARAQAAAILMRFCEKFVTEKTYTVTFDLNYGSDSTYTTQNVKSGEKASQPAAPTRSGYTFAGWYKNAVGGSKFDFGTAITADLTLYAHWTKNGGDTPYTPPTPPAPTTYTVTFNVQGHGSAPASQTVAKNGKVTEPTAPTADGYSFGGWYKEAGCTNKWNFTSDTVTGNTTLYAKWTDESPNLTIGEGQKIADGIYKQVGGTYNDVTISESVGNGDVTLENVIINGKLIVQGGGSNSIHLESCDVDVIEVDKDTTAPNAQPPRIELNNTSVETIDAVQPTIIEADAVSNITAVNAKSDVTVQGENTTVQNVTAAAENVKLTVQNAAVEKVTAENPVTIEATGENSVIKEVEAQSDVTVQGAATKVDKVTVPESAADTGVELKIEGAKVSEVAAENPVTINATDGASPIEKVEAKDNLTVKGDAAQIEQVEVPDSATKQPVIDVQSGTVSEVKADKPAEVKGDGTVTNVEANAEVKVASETVTTITVTVQVTVTVTGNQPVEVAVETTNAVSVVTANTNVSVSTTLNEEINVVKKETETSEGTKITHVHKWVEDTDDYVAATCTATGKRVYVCGGTGDCDVTERTKTVILDKLPHTEKIVNAVAATCTETGLTDGKVCAVCDAVLVKQTETAVLGHNYAEAWSSDSEGHWHECLNCGDKTNSAAHTPGAAATETADQTCTVCSYVIAPSLGHQCISHLTKTAAKAATCTAAGNSEYYTCTCGKFYSDANATTEIAKDSWIIAATGHAFGTATYEWKAVSGGYICTATRVCAHNGNHKETETVTATYEVTKAPTCSAVGSGTYTATFTNEAFAAQAQTKNVEIAKLLHKEETIPGKAATCTETGLTEGKHCSVCNTVLVAQTEIPALGHDWATEWSKDGTQHWHECRREGCDAKNDVADHIPGAAATESSAQTCTVCGYVITPALGHVCKNHLTAHEAVNATCTTAGYSAYWSCTCGKYYSDANAANEINENSWIISALGHNLTKTDAKSATCEENGNKAYWTCSRCHKVYSDAEGAIETTVAAQTLAATGHNYRAATYEWTAVNDGYTCTGKRVCANNETHVDEATATVTSAVTEATCTEKGETTYTATFTKEGFATQTKTEEIAVLGHSWATAWSKDETYHWHVCQREGCDAVNEKAAHSWNNGEVTTSATGTQNGVKTYTCTVCGQTKTEVIPSTNTVVTSYDDFVNALNNDAVIGITVNADITVPAQNQWTVLAITKPVVVAGGKTLTVVGYTTDGVKSGFLANDLTVVEGGSLTLGENAVLKTTAIQSGENEPFYSYVGRICVSGGTLDVSAGTVENGSFFNFNYVGQTTNSNALILGENSPEIEFSIHNEAQLRAAIADNKCTGGVIVEDDITLESDLTVTKLVLVNDDKTLTVPAGKTLTIDEGGMLQVSGTLNVYGTLTNNGEIFNLSDIVVFGGTLENTGVIRGAGDSTTISVENGGTLDNVIEGEEGTIGGVRISVIDYYPASGDPAINGWELFGDERDYTAPELDYFDLGAVAFGTDAIQTALDVCVGGQEGWYRYQYVIACGTEADPTVNTVKLDGINIHEGGLLILCNWMADELYRNDYLISEGETLTLNKNARLEGRNWGSATITIDGTIKNNGGSYDFGGMIVKGENAPVIIHSEKELMAALEKGGVIILEGTEEFVQVDENAGGRVIVLKNPVTVSKKTEFVNQFGNILYIPGLTINEGAALTVSNMTVVLAADSTISGTMNIGGNCFVMVRTPDEAQPGETTELTVANGGKIVIGGEDESFWNAQLGNAEGDNAGSLVNNGTIDVYGDLWFDNAGGTVNYKFIAEVDSRDEFLAAMESSVIRQVVFTGDMTLYSGDTFKGRGTKYEIREGVEVTLEKGDKDEVIVLEQGSDLKVYGKLIANCTVYAYAGIVTPDNQPRENYIVNEYNIHFMKNFADFGEFVYNAVGDRLTAVTDAEIKSYGDQDVDEWPGGEWDEHVFAFLVKYGGVEPWTDQNNEGRKYWPVHEPINYGEAKTILENIWTAINGEQSALPASVSLNGVIPQEHMDDERCNVLLSAFADALPKQEDSRTEITLIRDNVNEGDTNLTNDGMTITGKTFTNHITITCDPRYLDGDDFGGELKFVNCDFAGGVTIRMTDDVNFRVDFGNSCTGNATVEFPNGKTSWQDCGNRTNVQLFYVNGMSFDTANAFAEFNDWGHNETVSFTLNGLTITDEDEGGFTVSARYDENGRDNGDQPIFIPTVEVRIFAMANEVKISGNYTGKLILNGNADVSELEVKNDGFIEMGNSTWADIALGGNTIFVGPDCNGEHSFTGTADSKVIVRDQNSNVQIKVNGVDLGTPHIFGEHGDGIFFPLANTTGVSFKVEQRSWDEENRCDVWTVLNYTDHQEDDMLQLVGKEGEDWITDPNNVRVTVTVGGCSVVYDTMMWKPITEIEFANKLNEMLGTSYTFESFDLSDNYLTYGKAGKILSTAWKNYDSSIIDMPDLHEIIHDDNYWGQRDDWNRQHDAADDPEKWLEENEGWNPDNWTCDWFFANDVIRNLKSALGIKDTYGEVSLHLYRDQEHNNETLKAQIGDEWIDIDGNTIRDCRFTGTVTVFCGTERSENDDFGGCIFFENCDFEQGVTVELKQGINYGIRFNNCTGTVLTIKDGENTLAPITLGGANIAVDVRYDDAVPTAEIHGENEEEETLTVSGSGYTGKLRISGMACVSNLSFGENGWLELSNNGDANIALGSNEILVNDDCGGHYSFTGTGRVIVPNQNQYANITVNGINLGTPHVFGRNELGIFFPLTNADGLTFTVEQGQYDEDLRCVPDDGWTTLEYTVHTEQNMIQLFGKEDKPWLDDPYQVRVTVTVANGCTVVYDTMMWKPVQMDEFITELNTRLDKSYTLESLGISKTEGDLTFGDCKTAFEAIWVDFGKTDPINMNQIINDGGYWDELARWESDYQNALASEDPNWISDMENRSPDRWTRRWNDLDMMLDELTKALGISNDDGQQ